MKAKVLKSHSLALQTSTAKTYNPKLTLFGQPIHFMGTKAIKFLVSTILVPLDSQTTKIQLDLKLKATLTKVDKVPVTTHQKRLLNRVAV